MSYLIRARKVDSMEIRFGRPVVSVDGERVGQIEGLALDKSCRFVRQLLLLHGTDERAVPYGAVTNIDADGIIDVSLTAFEVQQNSLDHGRVDTSAQNFVPYTSWVSGETMAPSFSSNAPQSTPYLPTERAEPESDNIEIDGENVVAGPDGKVVGTIAGVEADDSGRIIELIIGTGFLRNDLRVNMESVEYIEGSYVSQIF
jgi:sporulation protein YlmC with PRC-barrel domain